MSNISSSSSGINLYTVRYSQASAGAYKEQLLLASNMEAALAGTRELCAGTDGRVLRVKELATDVPICAEASDVHES